MTWRLPSRPPRTLAQSFAAGLLLIVPFLHSPPARAQASTASQVRLPQRGGFVELEARQQRREGDVFHAEGDVDIRYQNLRLRADHVEFNTATGEAVARGNVRFDLDTQHLETDEARYNVRTGKGVFRKVRGDIYVSRRPNPNVLLTSNPFHFEAEEVERVDDSTYKVRGALITVCEPDRPIWTFHAPRAVIKLESSVRLEGASFRFFGVPVIFLPVATAPVGPRLRQSGFLVPHFANTTTKGFVFGDAFYWALAGWADLTLGAEYLSRRGWSQIAEFRARPWEDARLNVSYFGVTDRGLPGPGGVRIPQGGHTTRVELDSRLPGGWRAAADVNQLTSLRFRLAFAQTFEEAAKSEVRSDAFVTNNFRGFSLNFSAVKYKNFLSADPETAVVLQAAPGVNFRSVEQAPWKRLPAYFGFHVSAEAMRRTDPMLDTSAAVQRAEIAPRVTVPLRWGPWVGMTSTFLVRTTRYGSQQLAGTVVGDPLRRTTGEVTVDLRPPVLARIWEQPVARWKHTIEPKVVYRYVDGVNRFGRFLRFDENDTLTDTSELEYSITQRLFRRRVAAAADGGSENAEELLSWSVAQKYYFDPTFGGAIVPDRRNAFQALNSLTPFAFADGTRRFSPIVSDLRLAPGGRYDAQFRLDYDPVRGKVTALGTLVNVRPYSEFFFTLAHFATQANATLQPVSNQVRGLAGFGEINRRGLNGSFAVSYDVNQRFFQNQVAQVSWNGSCCGLAFEFRRLALGPVRSENQFRVALLLANIGTFGNLRRREKVF